MPIDADLKRLEEMTKRLEANDLPLEDALLLFEEALSLAKKIKGELDRAKLKVTQVIDGAKDAFSLQDFDLQ
ncbi:MAG: exodeoxyribonuclease VII small subunit [Candidatus Bipolaricaulota bacterium]|nr:exodeoxyribonuclease VII small subunit [Candidatus Bipolaricaulota bacterium]